MSYFLPSFFQKRLLRYALSRLELVDTDALDLDSLGITWGQRSTFELRDVALRLEKLSSTLCLPPRCDLTKASVSLVRVTIPADIYNSAIIIEVEGIDVRLRFLPDEARPNRDSNKSQAATTGGGGKDGQSTGESILPSTTDLAQSFLNSEPKEETEELQAALMSQSQHTQHADSLSDDGEEDLGLHDGVSLPSFVAGFLKGIVNRLQLKISNVSLRVDMEVQHDGVNKTDTQDPISGLFTIQDIAIDSVATTPSDDPRLKVGKRLVSLSEIHAMILSDAEVFSNHSRFNASSSTSAAPSKSAHTPSRAQSPPLSSSSSDSFGYMSQSTILDPSSMHESQFTDNSPGANSRHLESSAYSHDGRFSDAASDDGNDPEYYSEADQGLSDSQYDERFLDNPGYLEEALHSQYEENLEESTTLSGNRPSTPVRAADQTPRPYSPQSLSSSPESPMYHSIHESNLSISDMRRDAELATSAESDYPTRAAELHGQFLDKQAGLDSPHTSEEPDPGSQAEDLSASKIFTHEEAQSMYMSAISHASTSASTISEPDMPGGWGTPRPKRVPGVDSSDSNQVTRDQEPSKSCLDNIEHGSERLSQMLENLSEDQRSGKTDQAERSPYPSRAISGVVKELFAIDKVALWIPSAENQTAPAEESSESDNKPIDHMAESTFSLADSAIFDLSAKPRTRLVQSALKRGSMTSSRHLAISRPQPATNKSEDFPGLNTSQLARAIEIDVVSLSAKLDIASGWLLIKMGQKITDVWSPVTKKDETESPKAAGELPLPFFASLNLTSCSLKFLDRVPAQPYPLSTASSAAQFTGGIPSESTILQLMLSKVGVDFAVVDNVTKVRLNIGHFALGHMSHDMVSFDESLKMRESTRDISLPAHGDILLRVVKSPDFTTIHLATLPVCLSLNLQQLDETLGWLGGLSTVLELGSSIASTSTVKGGEPQPASRPRGVHFADPIPSPSAVKTTKAALNANCRIGGVVVQVIGEHCTLRLRTTAAKLVSRPEGTGLQIDRASLSGPHMHRTHTEPPAYIDISNTRLEYLNSPKETDLDRLLRLLMPSVDGSDEDDDIMLETLLRQRRNGAVLRFIVGHAKATVQDPEALKPLSHLSAEMSKLATVAKYLPQDDRPGMLILAQVRKFEGDVHVNDDAGDINVIARDIETGYVTFPSLLATRVSTLTVVRNDTEELIAANTFDEQGEREDSGAQRAPDAPPVLMVRFVADDMEPTVKVKLHNLRVEYTVPCLTALLGKSNTESAEDFAANMAQSVLNLAELKTHHGQESDFSERGSVRSDTSHDTSVPPPLSVSMKDCVLGLNPRKPPAKAFVVFSRASFNGALHKDKPSEAFLDISKASVMVIDDVDNSGAAGSGQHRKANNPQSVQVRYLQSIGFIPVCDISSASARIKVVQLDAEGQKSLDVEITDDLLLLETCADSTQTLVSILSGLAPLAPPSTERKYRTEVIPIEDMLNSLSGNAFAVNETSGPGSAPYLSGNENESHEGDDAEEIEYVSVFYPSQADLESRRGGDAVISSIEEAGDPEAGTILESLHSEAQISSSVPQLDFQEDHFTNKSAVEGTTQKWDSHLNTYTPTSESKLRESPLRVRIRDANVLWHLYDGYDWQRTRDTISKAVKVVEAKAAERRAGRPGNRLSAEFDEEEESVIGDFLFNSVYIGIPANRDPGTLLHGINRQLEGNRSDTMSSTTNSTVTGAQNQGSGTRQEKLRLARSKKHKIAFELMGISADLVVFPPGSGETMSSLDVRVQDLEIIDQIATSTWKKFATYMHDAGEREIGTSMVHLEIMTVKPVEDLAASEFVIRATVLPLRLHVDQDALDFLCRFFDFKDDSVPSAPAPEDVPYIQRAEVRAIPVKLDFKPKRVDYASLKSGRTTEFMNFFILDGADMVLRHVIIYGIKGFERLGQTLNDIWMPDVRGNQLPTVLAGLAPVRSLVNIGGGVKDLVLVPMREYKKDGRIVRSIQKGAVQFAKTTTNELLKLGAKLAIGTQTALQNAEDLFNSPRGSPSRPSTSDGRWEGNAGDESEQPQISLYADQPLGVAQGLRGAYSSLERDLLFTRDVIVAVPGEIMESGSATEAAKRVLGRAPTVVLRPAIAASKAVSQALLGVSNAMDPENRRKIEDKYKKHNI